MISKERVTRTAMTTSAAALVALLLASPAAAQGTKVRERGSQQSTGSERGGSTRVESGSKVPAPPAPRVSPAPPSSPRSSTPRVESGETRRDDRRDDRKYPGRDEVDRGTPRYHPSPYYRHYYPYHRSYWNWGFYWGVPYYWGDWDYYYYHRRPYPYPYPHARRYDYGPSLGALDLDVSPERAEIYLDGERVGIADEYDGFPGYLWLEPGTYDLVLYAPGFQTIARQVSIQPGVIYDVEDRMVPGEARRPEELASTSTVNRDERLRRERERAEAAERAEVERWEDRPWDDEEERRQPMEEDVARIHFHVLPGDAAIYLDGYFVGTADEVSRLSAGLMVDPGEHVVEVIRPGFRNASREIDLDEGDRVDVEIELDRD